MRRARPGALMRCRKDQRLGYPAEIVLLGRRPAPPRPLGGYGRGERDRLGVAAVEDIRRQPVQQQLRGQLGLAGEGAYSPTVRCACNSASNTAERAGALASGSVPFQSKVTPLPRGASGRPLVGCRIGSQTANDPPT